MPVRASQDKIRIHWLTALCAFDLLYGGVTIFGKTESVSQEYLRGLSLPPAFWGALLVLASGLIWWGWSVPGARVAGFAWAALMGASLMTITDAVSYGGPILFGYAAYQHALISHDVGSGLDSDRERRQRGG